MRSDTERSACTAPNCRLSPSASSTACPPAASPMQLLPFIRRFGAAGFRACLLAERNVQPALACNQQRLDLRRAVADGADPVIPEIARDRTVIHKAPAAVHLD